MAHLRGWLDAARLREVGLVGLTNSLVESCRLVSDPDGHVRRSRNPMHFQTLKISNRIGDDCSNAVAQRRVRPYPIARLTLQSAEMIQSRSTSVPKGMQRTYAALVGLTDQFCRHHLDEGYRELAQAMAAALCRKRPSPVASGQPRTWACAIIHVLGKVNFPSDPSREPTTSMAEVCAAFGVGQSTASAKGRVIWDALDTYQLDPNWTVSSLM